MAEVRKIAGALAATLSIMAGSALSHAAAQEQAITIQTLDGSDCTVRGGAWQGTTCSFAGGLDVSAGQALIIQGGAIVFVGAQLVNSGTIGLAESGQLIIGTPGGIAPFISYGSVVVVPTPGFASPGVSNYGQIQNFGVIFNAQRDSLSGIFNNFGTITNHNQITNNGFFHNSGPPAQATRVLIDNTGEGFFDNQGGTLENRGDIAGRVF